MRVFVLWACVALLAALSGVDAHVRLLYRGYNIRNAKAPNADGAFSVAGPCGGSLLFGMNGVTSVVDGATVSFAYQYNGGHNGNFQVYAAMKCGHIDLDTPLKLAENRIGTSITVNGAAKDASGQPIITMINVTMPLQNPARSKTVDCTLSIVDSNTWGGCVDLRVINKDDASSGGGGSSGPAKDPLWDGNLDMVTGRWLVNSKCDSTTTTCCCLTGLFDASLSRATKSIAITGTLSRNGCIGSGEPVTFTIRLMASALGTAVGTATIGGEDFSIAYYDMAHIIVFTNVYANTPTICSFSANRIPLPGPNGPNGPSGNYTVNRCDHPSALQLLQCAAKWAMGNVPPCQSDDDQYKFDNDCCKLCKAVKLPPLPSCPLSQIPACAAGSGPVWGNGTLCPNCIPQCSAGSLATCAKNILNLPVCDPSNKPRRSDDCCQNCRRDYSRYCNATQRSSCEARYDMLPSCANDETGAPMVYFDTTSCCRTCRYNFTYAMRDANGKCTNDQLRYCLSKVPVCEDGELPVDSASSCCSSCKRPERLCLPADVCSCRANRPACQNGEAPAYVEGECCPSCVVNKPVCLPACLPTQLCVRNVSADASYDQMKMAPGKCVDKKRIRFDAMMQAAAASQLSGWTSDHFQALLQEAVNRFCDRADNSMRCQRFQNFANQLSVISITPGFAVTGKVSITVDIPQGSSVSGDASATMSLPSFFHTLSSESLFGTSDDSSQLVSDSAMDSDALSGFQTTGSTALPVTGAAPSIASSLFVTFGAVIFTVFAALL